MAPNTPPLVTQLSSLPTRKLSATAVAYLLGVLAVAVGRAYIPGFDRLLDSDVLGVSPVFAVVGVVAWSAGYFVKDRANIWSQ